MSPIKVGILKLQIHFSGEIEFSFSSLHNLGHVCGPESNGRFWTRSHNKMRFVVGVIKRACFQKGCWDRQRRRWLQEQINDRTTYVREGGGTYETKHERTKKLGWWWVMRLMKRGWWWDWKKQEWFHYISNSNQFRLLGGRVAVLKKRDDFTNERMIVNTWRKHSSYDEVWRDKY